MEAMLKFKENLLAIIANIPLILSDSTDPKEVSLNRIMILTEFILVILCTPPILVYFLFKCPEIAEKCIMIFQSMLVAFGVHLGINSFKKVPCVPQVPSSSPMAPQNNIQSNPTKGQ